MKRELKLGLQGSSSINDKTIPTFSRGELPHFAGINTVHGKHRIARIFRRLGSTTRRWLECRSTAGRRIGRGRGSDRKGLGGISALYTPYNYETGVDLREQMTLCDAWGYIYHSGEHRKVVRSDFQRRWLHREYGRHADYFGVAIIASGFQP